MVRIQYNQQRDREHLWKTKLLNTCGAASIILTGKNEKKIGTITAKKCRPPHFLSFHKNWV
jgi:hypothetical protein